jgi:hypothetical protein
MMMVMVMMVTDVIGCGSQSFPFTVYRASIVLALKSKPGLRPG